MLDELGKLELKGEGIHQAANYIIGNYESSDDKNLLLVVRTNLVKDIIAHYDIKSFQIVAKEMLPWLSMKLRLSNIFLTYENL